MNGPEAGKLDRRITIQQRSTSKDTFGQESVTWSDRLSCWAKIEPLSGRELELGQAVASEVSHRVTVLYRAGITSAMRVLYQGRYFDIHGVLDVETAHVVLELLCGEGLNQGG